MGICVKNPGTQMNRIEIIQYEEKYLSDFKRLSYEWLDQYTLLEPEDERILSNPEKVILNKGGYVYFAKYGGEIIGTVSLIKVDDTTFELAKLAVTQKYRGMGIGRKLIERCLITARQDHIKKMILFTHHKLFSAIALYKKFNFKEVYHSKGKYIKSDLKMELDL